MHKNAKQVLVAGIDVARDRVEIGVFGWARIGHTASHMTFLFKKLGWSVGRPVRPAVPRSWLKQKKGRGAQL